MIQLGGHLTNPGRRHHPHFFLALLCLPPDLVRAVLRLAPDVFPEARFVDLLRADCLLLVFFEDFLFEDLRFEDCGQPLCICSYESLLTVERDLERLLPARLRRLMLLTREFLRLLAMRHPMSNRSRAAG